MIRILALLVAAPLLTPMPYQSHGTPATGAPTLSGFLVKGKPCIPFERFAMDAGHMATISPSGRHVGVVVNRKISLLLDGKRARINNQDLPLSVEPVALNGDYYLPLEFFEKAFPVKFLYDSRARLLTAQLPNKTLKIPIEPFRGR